MPMTLRQLKMNIQASNTLDVMAGLWLLISPFILGYASIVNAAWNSIILGVIVTVFAVSRLPGNNFQITWPSWVNIIAGIWLILSPFILSFTLMYTAFWNTVVLGFIITILAGWSAISSAQTNR